MTGFGEPREGLSLHVGVTDNVYYKEGGDNFLSDPWKECHCYHPLRFRSFFFFFN